MDCGGRQVCISVLPASPSCLTELLRFVPHQPPVVAARETWHRDDRIRTGVFQSLVVLPYDLSSGPKSITISLIQQYYLGFGNKRSWLSYLSLKLVISEVDGCKALRPLCKI